MNVNNINHNVEKMTRELKYRNTQNERLLHQINGEEAFKVVT
jgi:hypothetical protein